MIVQFGGQTPLNLSLPLKAAGVNIIGTTPESIDLAEDRKRFGKLLDELDIPQAPGAMVASVEEAVEAARQRWRRAMADGHTLTYWQQTPSGRGRKS